MLGDTNSCIAAVMAKRMRIPVYHMEAGNRCFDENVPEETNRRLVDHVADFNLVYTEHARRNLLAEGLHPRRILLTGSPMLEVLDRLPRRHRRLRRAASDSGWSSEATSWSVPIARRTSTPPTGWADSCNAWSPSATSGACPSTSRHTPGPASGSRHCRRRSSPTESSLLIPSVSMTSTGSRLDAACVLSDSGTIAEEATILGFPAVTLRDSIERPEALDTAGIMMTGLDPDDVVAAVQLLLTSETPARGLSRVTPADYAIDNTSDRTVRFIMSTARRHRAWSGLRD